MISRGPDIDGLKFVADSDSAGWVTCDAVPTDKARDAIAKLRELGWTADWAPDNDDREQAWIYASEA